MKNFLRTIDFICSNIFYISGTICFVLIIHLLKKLSLLGL